MTDPIADMLIRIKNGYSASKQEVEVPFSKIKTEILKILKKEGYIEDFKVQKREIKVKLKYINGRPALSGVKRISSPGQRIYVKKHEIPTVLSGYGIVIISTSQGVMTGKEARARKIGGELICAVW